MRYRWYILIIGVTIFWLALMANFFRLQVHLHDNFESMAKNQYYRKIKLHAQRGIIYDRAGNRLVTNTIHYDLAADPKLVKNKKRIAELCSRLFHEKESEFRKKLNQKGRFVFLARKRTEEEIAPILKLKDPGVIKIPVFRRSYLYGEYAAQLIGFTDPDDRGIGGLELQYDRMLRGEDGQAILQYSPGGRLFYNPEFQIKSPRDGNNIYLTIDKNIQTVVEQELRKGVEKARARAGMCVVMDPQTGRVLAMANYPSFDPNRQEKYPPYNKRNRAVSDLFEPGSTIKSFVAAILLQTKLKKPQDLVYCENGRFSYYRSVFTDSKPHGWMTFKKVVSHSSNIGMIKLTEDLPPNTMFRFLKSFGFGSETGIDLMSEAKGILEQPRTWSAITRASLSIGYGISVTTLQLAAAYSALVNGGKLYRPYAIWKITSPEGKILEEHQPKMIRRVISETVSKKVKKFLEAVVEEGTGTQARIRGVKLGGKTGTARKINPNGGYYHNKYIASFAGFAPLEQPKYVCVVVVDEPKTFFYGGQVAAPIFQNILSRILNLDTSIPHEVKNDDDFLLVQKNASLPDLAGLDAQSAIRLLESKDLDYRLQGEGAYVLRSSVKDDEWTLELGDHFTTGATIPRLSGLTLREALSLLDLSKINLKIKGDPTGIIYKQNIKPGTVVKKQANLVLTCISP
ncbi:penicillin-binding protein [Caldithrix abyssi]|uniref:Penicillin-binding protein transpeptidase n=2 Tax=Caldithrix abyssi DSM 13497 TaxID=880073 RepID=H1XY43_CALAY|nr:penicillin-binding protein [Caldithrix abyssi]EHO41970.1 penicillin-binding protein transpeptidase [Caldithrix abyssi DSM 13497]